MGSWGPAGYYEKKTTHTTGPARSVDQSSHVLPSGKRSHSDVIAGISPMFNRKYIFNPDPFAAMLVYQSVSAPPSKGANTPPKPHCFFNAQFPSRNPNPSSKNPQLLSLCWKQISQLLMSNHLPGGSEVKPSKNTNQPLTLKRTS